MPNKKSKPNASKGSPPAPPVPTQAATPSPPIPVNPPHISIAPIPTATTEDFWPKNARAKALIMSTLVPGSEPWKIAEPLELASDIWKALEAKYAPKDAKKKSGNGKTSDPAGDKTEKLSSTKPLSSNFIGDWVQGKSLDKYLDKQLDMYKSGKSEETQSDSPQADLKSAGRGGPLPNVPAVREHVPKELPNNSLGKEREPQQSQRAPPSNCSAPWRASPANHDSYLSESQALAFAQNDLERKRQIQVAATKVLMQKLPTRDLRFLWALLYGGENAPWPGSYSVIIPGVTTGLAAFNTFRV